MLSEEVRRHFRVPTTHLIYLQRAINLGLVDKVSGTARVKALKQKFTIANRRQGLRGKKRRQIT